MQNIDDFSKPGIFNLCRDAGNDDVVQYYSIIHQESLCIKSIRQSKVMSDIIKIVNLILSRGLNHRQFQAFLEEISAEYDDVPYFSQVRWLSAGRVLKRFYELRKEREQFLLLKDQSTSVFSDSEWLSELAFLVDIKRFSYLCYQFNDVTTNQTPLC